jgi:hypothetical protein
MAKWPAPETGQPHLLNFKCTYVNISAIAPDYKRASDCIALRVGIALSHNPVNKILRHYVTNSDLHRNYRDVPWFDGFVIFSSPAYEFNSILTSCLAILLTRTLVVVTFASGKHFWVTDIGQRRRVKRIAPKSEVSSASVPTIHGTSFRCLGIACQN